MYIISGYHINEFKVKGSLFKSYTYDANGNNTYDNGEVYYDQDINNLSYRWDAIYNGEVYEESSPS